MRTKMEGIIKAIESAEEELSKAGKQISKPSTAIVFKRLAEEAIELDDKINIISKIIDTQKGLIESNQDTIFKLIDMIEGAHKRLDILESGNEKI